MPYWQGTGVHIVRLPCSSANCKAPFHWQLHCWLVPLASRKPAAHPTTQLLPTVTPWQVFTKAELLGTAFTQVDGWHEGTVPSMKPDG